MIVGFYCYNEVMDKSASRHHLLYPALEWNIRPQGAELRGTPSLIYKLPRFEHDIMHEEVAIVPLLGHNTLRSVARIWTPEHDTFKDIDGLCRAIGKAALHERSQPIETSLAELTVEALQAQKRVLINLGHTAKLGY